MIMATGTIKKRNVTKTFTKSYTIAANNITRVDFDVTQSGLTPIAVVGYDSGHGSAVVTREQIADDTTAYLGLRNLLSSSISSTATIIIQYI